MNHETTTPELKKLIEQIFDELKHRQEPCIFVFLDQDKEAKENEQHVLAYSNAKFRDQAVQTLKIDLKV